MTTLYDQARQIAREAEARGAAQLAASVRALLAMADREAIVAEVGKIDATTRGGPLTDLADRLVAVGLRVATPGPDEHDTPTLAAFRERWTMKTGEPAREGKGG